MNGYPPGYRPRISLVWHLVVTTVCIVAVAIALVGLLSYPVNTLLIGGTTVEPATYVRAAMLAVVVVAAMVVYAVRMLQYVMQQPRKGTVIQFGTMVRTMRITSYRAKSSQAIDEIHDQPIYWAVLTPVGHANPRFVYLRREQFEWLEANGVGSFDPTVIDIGIEYRPTVTH